MASNRRSSACLQLAFLVVLAWLDRGTCFGEDPRFEFVEVPAGEFLMGCGADDSDCDEDERPAHRVELRNGFEIGKYEVTQAQWMSVMGSNPSHFLGAAHPVENVSWTAAREFVSRLNRKGDPYLYRLPTEAEWEYAARAGDPHEFAGDLDESAWHWANAGDQTHQVGTKRPNAWGLHDMLGNVWEWCGDRYAADYYGWSPVADPQGPSRGDLRVMRGGSWYRYAWFLRYSARFRDWPDAAYRHVGLRCVRTKR
ncbi:MAG: formylglycine-generating enzyme family protein [Bryobacterales bacterium]|nr:formylglycine-generating enzyme family protein [Bryobacterales bacterium]